ncbi:hypothetical protein QFC22_004815 [Naganishia vaughanmartiniae]|uniref:Uncharacterized protein n=1 Tax=Naganishia vaughanmartiniae TaxID=1424756 RepID=A0ACC2WYY3_9TREE|nr:hypothetical protein QFC22_004815 [Naganishia vaughanmartiniae]
MLDIRHYIPKLYARAGAPTSGLIHSTSSIMSATSTAVRVSSTAVRAKTTPVVSTSAKAATSTSLKLNTPTVSSTTSQARDVATSVSSKVSLVVQTPTRTSTMSSSTSIRLPTTPSPSSALTSTSNTVSSTTRSSSSSRLSTSTSSSSSTNNILSSAAATSISKPSSGISGGAIAGIIIGVLIVGLVAAIFLYRMIQRRRRANRRMTGGLQAWTDRTSYFSASGSGAAVGAAMAGREEREMGAGQVPFREVQDKDQDGGPWVLEEKGTYHEPIMMATVPAGNPYDQQQHAQQVYPQPYAQQTQYQPYPPQQQQPYNQNLAPHTPSNLSQPQGYPMIPSPGPGTPNTFGGVASPTPSGSSGMIPAQALAHAQGQGQIIQDGMNVVVRQGFIRTLEDELVIAPGDNLFVVQAYDDGWCLCRSIHNEQGVVPQSCLSTVVSPVLSPFSATAENAQQQQQQQRMSNVPVIQMPLPAVVVSSDGAVDEVLAPMMRNEEHSAAAKEMTTLAPPLSRSETTRSLAVSERSERRSSLFLNAAAAGLYLQQNSTPTY